jgi:flavin-binding protein dodecin
MTVVKIIQLVGESPTSWEDAANNLMKEAKATLRGITRIGITEMDIRMKDDDVDVYRVRADVSFRIER